MLQYCFYRQALILSLLSTCPRGTQVEWGFFKTTALSATDASRWLLSAWGNPSSDLLCHQLKQEALRSDMNTGEHAYLCVDRVVEKDLVHKLSQPELELNVREGRVSQANFVACLAIAGWNSARTGGGSWITSCVLALFSHHGLLL